MRTWILLPILFIAPQLVQGQTSAREEKCVQVLSYKDVLQTRVDGHGFLEKMSIDSKIESLNLPQSEKHQLKSLDYLNVKRHLVRVLRNNTSEPERAFEIALLQNYAQVERALKRNFTEWSYATDCIETETSNTPIWWTFSPYIFKYLHLRGASDYEAVKRLVDWAAAGKMKFGGNSSTVTLPGVNFLNERRFFGRNTFVLDLNDPNHITHRYVDQEALILVSDSPFFSLKN